LIRGEIYVFYSQNIPRFNVSKDKDLDLEKLEKVQRDQQSLHYQRDTLMMSYKNLFSLRVWDYLMCEDLQDMLAAAGPFDQIEVLKSEIEITEHHYVEDNVEWFIVG